MSQVTAICSMLHEQPECNSATRAFRGRPVLEWTLRRLSRSQRVDAIAILCWEDQLSRVAGVADEAGAYVLAKGPRVRLAEVEAVTAARRWSDGWRGGLLGTCAFDLGFYGPWYAELAEKLTSEAVILIDPAAALVDPVLADALVSHAVCHPEQEICFAPAAPGLGGALLRHSLLKRLAAAKVHAGRLLHYMPDHLSREMIGTDACLSVPTPIARTLHRFTLDSARQIARIEHATKPLNGQLIGAGAVELVHRVQTAGWNDGLPREVVVELGTGRHTNPIFLPTHLHRIKRPNMTPQTARVLFEEVAQLDDVRLTLSGVGDPLQADTFLPILELAERSGLHAIHVETDLRCENPAVIERLANSSVDVVSVSLPALTEATYRAVMGIDGLSVAMDRIRQFLAARQQRGGGIPILVPVFTKCRQNMAEMEGWYDQWLRALGSAVIRSPSHSSLIDPEVIVADMTPPGRRACQRLETRLTVHSDGTIVTCEEDVLATQALGKVGQTSIAEVWRDRMARLRDDHKALHLSAHSLCQNCKEWHRP